MTTGRWPCCRGSALALALLACAATAPAMDMYVNLVAGGAQTFTVEEIQRITFDLAAPARMLVTMVDANVNPFELSTVRSITFVGELTGVSRRHVEHLKAQFRSFRMRRAGAVATLTFTLPEPEQLTVAVYRLDGVRVATLLSGTVSAGEHIVFWDGRDGQGGRAASGNYVMRMDRKREARAFSFVTIK
jgi:hypothetical protein